MAHLLGGEELHIEFPTRTVFEGVTVGVNEGDRIGIVGRNGDGKSTLLSLLGGRLEPDSGKPGGSALEKYVSADRDRSYIW